MVDYRIKQHPILPVKPSDPIEFYWQGKKLVANQGEPIAAALIANGVKIFGYHHKDGSPQGIYCANGQCAQCMVIANGRPVKSCMELVQPDMRVEKAIGLPVLPIVEQRPVLTPIEELQVPVLIIGGGPAGLSAAIELGKLEAALTKAPAAPDARTSKAPPPARTLGQGRSTTPALSDLSMDDYVKQRRSQGASWAR